MAGHMIGERFVLLSAATLLPFDVPTSAFGTIVRVLGAGVGDAGAVVRESLFTGRAIRPPPPVHLSARRLTDGTIRVGWVRRSRSGWAWLDGTDTPLGEETERYLLTIAPDVGATRTVETTVPAFDYSPAMQTADGAIAGGALSVSVVQVGALASSDPPARGLFIV